MPEQSTAAEVAFDEYPNVATTRRLDPDTHTGTFEFPSLNGHAPKPPRPLSRWAKAFRFFRKLIRRRQESAALKHSRLCHSRIFDEEVRNSNRRIKAAEDASEKIRSEWAKEASALTKRIESRDRALDELRQKMERQVEQLQQTIASRDRDIKNHVELEIPKLKRELQVKDAHICHLEALVEKKLSYEEAEIALHNKHVVDAETAADQLRQSAYLAERGR